ncbi:energy-coupling factor transporter transmembrane component T family protein [Salininema proteolyticum]|uniref:Energy-coupling factor transporter transmembrane component T family protein n=1 Tax=Salininema proteolyticum TaxID=1607685 RepID=A0ABV8U4K9_9ACTN
MTALAERDSALARLSPLSKIIGAAAVSVTAFLPGQWQYVAALLAFLVVLTAVSGINPGALAKRLTYLWGAALMVGVVNTVYAENKTGDIWWQWGPVTIASDAAENGAVFGFRVAVFSLAGLLGLGATDPTDLSDSLIQKWRFPERFTIGALSALRMMPLLAEEWNRITQARRARGLEGRGNIVRRLRLFASTMFGLLVVALRRGQRLAVSIEARGFDPDVQRSCARRAVWRRADTAVTVLIVGFCTALATVYYVL